jgi:glyoxylase-like metal-dependent hydrolase (beta-lactamase superfamily II)
MIPLAGERMNQKILKITLPMPLGMGTVNCYLVQNQNGNFLIDTGGPNNEKKLIQELEKSGCPPDKLSLIIITHGDFDHIGNAAYLKNKYGLKIAMHPQDAGMAEQGNMFFNRKSPNFLVKILAPLFMGFRKSKYFSPDIFLQNGDSLTPYGLDGRVISMPGHSKGSIGIRLESGELISGDLLDNTKEPGFTTLLDDQIAANNSLMRLQHEGINIVYPGHGAPFDFKVFQPKKMNDIKFKKI